MYYDGDRRDSGSRTYALHRTGFAGMQRYGGWLWSGDVYSTWSKLREQIPMGLNTGVSGIPYWGTDIGGFFPTPELTGELYARWFQLGAFNASFRSHGRNWHTRLPWGWNTGDPGPIEVGERPPGQSAPDIAELHNPLVEPVCRKYLNLRYQLLPYTYSLADQATESCLPFMRPLWMYYSEKKVYEIQDQYLWGRDLLIAPVTEKGAASRRLYLPKGDWYDFWTSEKISGGKEISRKVDLSTMPIYARAGAVLPMGPEIQHTAENTFGKLIIRVYPGENGQFILYEDDGHSYDYQQGEYMKTEFKWNDSDATLMIRPESGMNLCPGNQREITVRLMSTGESKSLIYRGDAASVTFDN
jgi:alpha-glucosidase/alpha-D-xyloside xylohydrolase